MFLPRKQTIEEEIFNELLDGDSLKSTYCSLITNYANFVFKLNKKLVSIDINVALRIVDLLINCTQVDNKEFYHLIGQQMIVILNTLYPNNLAVKYYLGNTLSILGNFVGIDTANISDFESYDILDSLLYFNEKEGLQIPNEDKKYFFYDQKTIYDYLNEKYTCFSGPTSMGKSFVIETFIYNEIINNKQKNYVILVPSKALINEVKHSFLDKLQKVLQQKNYRIVSGVNDIVLKQPHNYIFILTPERLLHIVLSMQDLKLDFVFVDEAHKMSENDDRDSYYYKVLDLISDNQNMQIAFASPNVPNPYVFIETIQNNLNGKINTVCSQYSPVCQFKFLIDINNNEIDVYDEIEKDLVTIETNSRVMDLNDLISIVGNNKQNVVYCNSKPKLVQYALEYAKNIKEFKPSEDLVKLANDIKKYVHKDCYLYELILKGVAYHMGYLPTFIRAGIESEYKKGNIKTIFCTSTLLEGVNLPADNLIILTQKRGNRRMDPISFKNLIGRVGRIKYNLYGNVFLVAKGRNVTKNSYSKLLNSKIDNQKLSVDKEDINKYFDLVVSDLVNGDIELKNTKLNAPNNYNKLRKYALTLIRDLAKNRKSKIVKSFMPFINEETKSIIINKFPIEITSDDISISNDQEQLLKKSILEEKLKYPDLINDENIFDSTLKFLYKLKEIFKWNLYDDEKLGLISLSDERKYKSYVIILINWMKGKGVNSIIQRSLKYKESNGYLITNYYTNEEEPYDSKNKVHINHEIESVLDTVDRVILFSIANYFRKFSLAYKELNDIQDSFENDWYEYVEFGTTNRLTIFLQQCGFTRESAIYLEEPKNKSVYIKEINDDFYIYKSIFECDNTQVKIDAGDVILNVPDIFIDSE